MNPFQQQPLSKQLRFYKLLPDKKYQKQQTRNKSLQSISQQYRRFHQTIQQILSDYQYFQKYTRQQLNMTEGQRVLKMNGIKIIKQLDSYMIQKYISKQQNILSKVFSQQKQASQKVQSLKISFTRIQTLTDPRYMLSLLGYVNKQVSILLADIQKNYFDYVQNQSYRCPAYGIQIVIFAKREDVQYVMIDSVCNYEGKNQVTEILVNKLADLLTQQNDIDPYTLRPRGLKYGPLPQAI